MVEVYEESDPDNENKVLIEVLEKDESIRVESSSKNGNSGLTKELYESFNLKSSKSKDIRGEETVAMIENEKMQEEEKQECEA